MQLVVVLQQVRREARGSAEVARRGHGCADLVAQQESPATPERSATAQVGEEEARVEREEATEQGRGSEVGVDYPQPYPLRRRDGIMRSESRRGLLCSAGAPSPSRAPPR
jgi:hypothetical protein